MAASRADIILSSTADMMVRGGVPSGLVARGLSENQGILLGHLLVWCLTVVTGIFLGLRFFAIWYRKIVLVVDDGLLIAAWVITVFYATTNSLELALGLGRQAQPEGGGDGPSSLLLLDNVARTLALTAGAWSKSAFACSLLGLDTTRPARWGLRAMVVLLNMDVVGTIVAHWVRCRPIFRAWDTGVDGTCWPQSVDAAIQISAQAYFAFCDLVLVVVGYLLVRASGLSRSEKVGVGFLMALGLVASAGAIVTAVEISLVTTDNFTESNIRVLLAAAIDPAFTILAASLPALRLLTPSYHYYRSRAAHDEIRVIRTPTSPLGLRPPRPARPSSSRSFMTTDTANTTANNKRDYYWTTAADQQQKRGGGGAKGWRDRRNKRPDSSENLLKGVDYNYSYWNPAIPPTGALSSMSPPGTASTNRTLTNFNTMAAAAPVAPSSVLGSGVGVGGAREYMSPAPVKYNYSPSSPTPAPAPTPALAPAPAQLPPAKIYSTYSPYGNNPAADNTNISNTTINNDNNNNNNNTYTGFVGDEAGDARRLTTLDEESPSGIPSFSSTVRSSKYSVGNLMRHVEVMMPSSHREEGQRQGQQPRRQPLINNGSNGSKNSNNSSTSTSSNPRRHRRGGQAPVMRSRDSPTLGDWAYDGSGSGGGGDSSSGGGGGVRDVADDYFSQDPPRGATRRPPPAPATQTWSQRFLGVQF